MNSLKSWISKHQTIIIAAFLLSILLGLFSKILEDVYEKDPRIINADINIANYITSIRDPILNKIFLTITELGNPAPLMISFAIVIILFFVYKKYHQLITIFLTLGGSGVITFVIKNIVQRARPIDGLIVEHGFSFPSGHAFAAVCFWAVLFYLLSTLTKNKPLKILLIIAAFVVAFLIGFSRIYIGVHWPSDVIASYLLSTVYTVIVIVLIHNREAIYTRFKSLI